MNIFQCGDSIIFLARCSDAARPIYLVVLFDDVLRCQCVVLQISGQVEHVFSQLLLLVVVVLQDGVQLCSRLTLIQRKTSAQRQHFFFLFSADEVQTGEIILKKKGLVLPSVSQVSI